jgi:hypothetical protein
MVVFSSFLAKIQGAIELDVTETGPDQDHQGDNGYCFSLASYRISRQELIRFVHSIVRDQNSGVHLSQERIFNLQSSV